MPAGHIPGEVYGARWLDIAPTLLELGGYDIPGLLQGKSLVAGRDIHPQTDGLSTDDEAILRERLSGLSVKPGVPSKKPLLMQSNSPKDIQGPMHVSRNRGDASEFAPSRLSLISTLYRRVLFGGDDMPMKDLLLTGVFIWSIFSAAQIYLKGIVLDEVVLPAQIIPGFVQYPQGHPYQVFFPQAYSFFHYFAALLFRLIQDKYLVSIVFNFAFVFLSTFLPYALTTILTKRPIWGFFACAILLSESVVNFQGVYPIWVFPTFYSHSHIALQIALLIVVLLLSKLWKPGGFLLGLLPSIHPAMAAIIWPWAVAYIWWGNTTLEERKRTASRILSPLIWGIAICVLIGLVTSYRHFTMKLAFPYDEPIDGNLIYQQFVARMNVHTQNIPLVSRAYFINPIVYFLFLLLIAYVNRDRNGDQRVFGISTWLLVLGAIVWVTIYGASLYQKFIGPLNFYISLLKPYRYSNLTATLLIPLSATLVATVVERLRIRERLISFGLLSFLVLIEGVLLKTNRSVVFREIIYVSWGVAFGLLAYYYVTSFRHLLVVSAGFILLVSCLSLVLLREFHEIDTSILAGFILTFLALRLGERLTDGVRFRWDKVQFGLITSLFAGCLIAGLAGMTGFRIWDQWNTVYDSKGNGVGRWDKVTPYDIELDNWLKTNAQPDEIILPFIYPLTELQAKTNHPVLFEMETLYLMDFIPGISAPIGLMYRDLFGVDLSNIEEVDRISKDGRLAADSQVCADTWINRKQSEWQALGRKYDFRLVLSIDIVPLSLPKALSGPVWTLYTIP